MKIAIQYCEYYISRCGSISRFFRILNFGAFDSIRILTVQFLRMFWPHDGRPMARAGNFIETKHTNADKVIKEKYRLLGVRN